LDVQEWLAHVPAVSIYLLTGVVVGVESLGIPLPGEIVLVAATLLASQEGTVDPVVLGACASAGAIVGDSTGYAIGRRGGRPLLARLGRAFPRHFGPGQIAAAERSFDKWGMWAVFFGRFVALLRIFAGPLAGVLRMPYWKFLTANVLGGVAWAGGTTAVIYYVGVVADAWLKRFSWIGLVLAVLIGIGSLLVVRHRTKNDVDSAAGAAKAGAGAHGTGTATDEDTATGTTQSAGRAAAKVSDRPGTPSDSE
jgi:membrane protein DedA with SNARE-associated domain